MKILFLGANGIDTSRLRIDVEFRDIQAEIERARASREIEVRTELAVTPVDLNRLLLEYEPDVVHFSGHGTLQRFEAPARASAPREFEPPDAGFTAESGAQSAMLLETRDGQAAPVSADALARLFGILKTQRCVVLNACFSAAQAASIATHVDCVIGMKRAIDDKSATVFAVGFYQAIARGQTVKAAFDLGCSLIATCGLPGADVPELQGRVDPETVRLVEKRVSPARARPSNVDASARVIPNGLDLGARYRATRTETQHDGKGAIGVSSILSGLPVSGENRVCTVMFVDLASVTRGAKWNPESVKVMCDRHFRVLEEQVDGLGGFVQRLVGNRALVLFGVPRAAENDVERGVVAAMRTRAAMRRLPPLREPKGARPSVRIGVSTGRVFVQVEGTSLAEISVVGDAVDLAARLQQIAPEGAIVIEREAYRQVRDSIDVEPLAPVTREGSDEVITAFRVVAPSSLRPVFPASDFHGFETRFVGRNAEQRKITDAYETVVAESRSQLLTLVGAPGLGRSRLLSETLTGLLSQPEPPLILLGQGSPLFRDTNYGFLASTLRRLFGAEEGDSPVQVRRKLRRGLRWFRMRKPAVEHAEDWPSALGMPDDETQTDEQEDGLLQLEVILGIHAGGATLNGFSDESSHLVKPRIRSAVSRLLRFIARRTPVAFLCNDLQWVDDASLDLFDDVLREGSGLPIFALCGTRPDLFERRPQWGEDREGHVRIDLAPLPRRYIEEMIRDRLRAVPSLPPDLAKMVADRAEGSPTIAEETLHLLLDSGVIEARTDKPWTVHEDRMGELSLPNTIQGIVQERIDRLDPETRLVLVRAAVVGRSFWQGALEFLCRDMQDMTEPETSLERHLDVLRERLLIRRRRPSSIPGEQEYVFVDSATYEVAHQMPSRKVLGPLHLLVAGWLEGKVADRSPAVIATHYDHGGDLGRAVEAYERAALNAASLGENAEALRHLERAREIHDDTLGADAEGLPASRRIASAADRVRIRVELGDVLRRIGRLDEATRSYEEARERILREERRASGELDPAELILFEARIDYRLGLLYRVRGALDASRVLVERAIGRAIAAGARGETPPMFAVLVFLYRRVKRPDDALVAARRGLGICRSIRERDSVWRMNVVESLLGLAVALLGKKRLGAAERTFRQVSRMLSESAHPHQISLALNGIAGLRLMQGDLRGAREYLLRSLRLKERAGDLHQLAIAYSNLAEVELRLSEIHAAVGHAKRSVALGEQARAGYDLADMYKNLALACLAVGDLGGALDAGAKALAIAGDTGKIYLKDVASTVAKSCARVAAEAPPGSSLHAQASSLARTLEQVLDRFADDPDLGQRAVEWRSLLEPLLEQTR